MNRPLACVFVLVTTACGGQGEGVESWQARAPERYVIRTCGTGFAPPSCSLAAVEAGRVVSLSNRFLPDEPWVSASSDDAQDPIAGLFESAASAPEGCKTSVQRDPVYAFPSRIYFDCGEEGWGLSVACFKPNALDASLCQ